MPKGHFQSVKVKEKTELESWSFHERTHAIWTLFKSHPLRVDSPSLSLSLPLSIILHGWGPTSVAHFVRASVYFLSHTVAFKVNPLDRQPCENIYHLSHCYYKYLCCYHKGKLVTADLLKHIIGLSPIQCGYLLDIQIVNNSSNTFLQILKDVTAAPKSK